jgi:hypothetical protein
VPHASPSGQPADRYAAALQKTREMLFETMTLRAKLVEERIEREHAQALDPAR